MKLFRSIKRYFRDAFKSVFRNFPLSLASISCITITLIVVAFGIIISYNVENFAKNIRDDVTVVIFLDSEVKNNEIGTIEKQIKDIGNIDSLKFKSKQQSAEETKKESEIFATIVDNWTDETNPLLDSFLLKVKDVEKIKQTVTSIKALDKVYSVNYGENMVDQLITVFKIVERVCIGAVVALIIVTAFLISNTIKLAIFSRKTEIEIMRLVGASNVSIKVPFIIEGLFIGMLGSIIPIILTIYGYNSLYNYFGGKLLGSALAKLLSPIPFVYYTSIILLIIGVLVGMYGSWRAVKKYLKI